MNSDFYARLGKNIKYYRKQKNWTQQELADKMGISLNFMGKIEVAFSKPSLDTLIDFAEVFDISVLELTNFSTKK